MKNFSKFFFGTTPSTVMMGPQEIEPDDTLKSVTLHQPKFEENRNLLLQSSGSCESFFGVIQRHERSGTSKMFCAIIRKKKKNRRCRKTVLFSAFEAHGGQRATKARMADGPKAFLEPCHPALADSYAKKESRKNFACFCPKSLIKLKKVIITQILSLYWKSFFNQSVLVSMYF